jgi:hypothetical protein
MNYSSIVEHKSAHCPEVRFRIRRLSLAGRIELLERVREAGGRLEFLQAGNEVVDTASAAAAQARIDELYVRWGLDSVEGIDIDGEPASTESLLSRGPNRLAVEIAELVRAEIFLSEEERKN